MESVGSVFICFGCLVMAVAGIGYWRSDPLLFLTTPVWQGEHRGLFRSPGWQLYLLGTTLAFSGSGLLLVGKTLATW